ENSTGIGRILTNSAAINGTPVTAYLLCARPRWLTMSRQAFAQSRHAFAHCCMCLSSGVFSQAAPQRSQAFAHASQMVTANGPWREAILAAAAQNSAQSAQVCQVVR